MKSQGRVSLNLKSSLCTDNPTGSDTYPFNSEPTQVVSNTGIERNGGVTAQYEQETTFATAGANSIITDSGDLLQVDASHNVRLNNVAIGNVGALVVYNRGTLRGYLDAAWTADDTLLAITISGKTITLHEINPSTMADVNSRSITFAGAGFVVANIRSITFVRYVDMHYADNQEFIVCYLRTTFDLILKEAGTTITTLVTNNFNFVNFAHRFTNGNYVFGMQNGQRAPTPWLAGDILFGGAGANNMTSAKWAIIHRKRGTTDSRALFTFPVFKDAANNLSGSGKVGYDGAGAYTGTITNLSDLALGAVVVTTQNLINAPGCTEATYTRSDTGTNIYSACYPDDNDTWNGGFAIRQSQTQTPVNGYGKLSTFTVTGDAGGTFGTTLVTWRLIMVNGVPALLSAVETADLAGVGLGVPMTQNGEFDVAYLPHIVDTATYSRIIYSYLGVLHFIDIRASVANPIERVSSTVYKINTLCPMCIVDTMTKDMHLGPNDYNGRVRWMSAGAITTTTKIATIYAGAYAGSIDVGDKLTTQTIVSPPANNNAMPFCSYIPSYWAFPLLDLGKQYAGDIYSSSFTSGTTAFTDFTQVGTLYVPDTRQVVAVGYHFGDRTVLSDFSTIFSGVGVIGSADVDYGYAGYELGNETNGTLVSFTMFEQRYLYDGFDIFLTNFSGPIFTGTSRICPAIGVTFIAASPTEAYFLSSYDNSLYVFNGGRSLIKMKRMNDIRNSSDAIETIINGVYSVQDNTLCLQTAGTFIWIRDGLVTQTFKKANQTSLTLYDTQDGIQIANNTLAWRYSFYNLGTTNQMAATSVSSVVALTWQSAYHSLKANELSVTLSWMVTLFSPDGRITSALTLRCHSFDQDGYHLNRKDTTITPSDWDALGFVRIRIQPESQKALASSLQIDYTTHMGITDVSIEYGDEAPATIRAVRSL